MKEIQNINVLISERERKMNAEFEAHQKRQAKIVEAAQAEAEKLKPDADAIVNLRTQLNGLTLRRDNLLEEIRIGRIQITQQQEIVAHRDRTVEQIFGKPNGNPNDFKNLVAVHGMMPFAEMLVEKFTVFLSSKQDELETVEAEIVALDRTAK